MAKWGEGDPRWIVEQRADSHNVNNWHWKEIDATQWSKDYLKSDKCLSKIILDDKKTGQVKITEVSTLEGEATCSIRKQKFIFIFDWEKISLKFSGKVAGLGDTEFTGVIKVEGFDHDCDDEDELDFEVNFKKEGPPEHAGLKAMIKKLAPKSIWEEFMNYKKSCKDHFSERLALSKENAAKAEAEAKAKNVGIDLDKAVPIDDLKVSGASPAKTSAQPISPKKQNSENLGAKIPTKKITMSDVFKGSQEEVFSMFIDINKIRVWSQNSLKFKHSSNLSESLEFQKGTKFDLFSDNVLVLVLGVFKKILHFLVMRKKRIFLTPPIRYSHKNSPLRHFRTSMAFTPMACQSFQQRYDKI